MIFASYSFVLGFLPAVVLAVVIARRLRPGGRALAAWTLILASLLFYGWWDWRYLFLIVGSTVANYIVGSFIAHRGRGHFSSYAFAFGIGGNLAVLGYFKYANFAVANMQTWWGVPTEWVAVVLPLGISFFTFQKIAFLVDCHRGEVVSYRFRDFLLFVLFFPQLIAGPITHHKEFVSQIDNGDRLRVTYNGLSIGLVIFTIGLFKKAVLADTFAMFANAMFDNLGGDAARRITFIEAWGGMLAYSFQIYFDFSGYSDMAIGMAAMFGIRLPINFDAPYRAASIIDFWRRWHVTLSRFLRDYVYISLGGNRRGTMRLYINLFLTMVLGGIWHGANWTFLIWGVVHGCILAINHGWRRRISWNLPRPAGWLLTMLCVVTAWAYFRAETIHTANAVVGAMWGFNGLSLPVGARSYLAAVAPLLEAGGIKFNGTVPAFTTSYCMAWIGLGLAIVLFLPTTHEWLKQHAPALPNTLLPERPVTRALDLPFRLSSWTGMVVAVALGMALLRLAQAGTFIYWQF